MARVVYFGGRMERPKKMPEVKPLNKMLMSVVMMTRNEAHNIKACLESLQDFDEVIVVDNGSSDETCAIVELFPNARLLLSDWKGYGGTRQVGVDAATHDWIFWFDADERMTPELMRELQSALTHASPTTVLSIPRRNFFVGHEIRGCGWSSDRVSRVFNRKTTRFDDKAVHEGLTAQEKLRIVQLQNVLLHYSYQSVRQFFRKNLNYALLAADEHARVGRSVRSWQLFLRPLWEFFRTFFLKQGFRDGLRGLIICFGSATYVFVRDSVRYFEAHE